jgi:hypothetical protein
MRAAADGPRQRSAGREVVEEASEIGQRNHAAVAARSRYGE